MSNKIEEAANQLNWKNNLKERVEIGKTNPNSFRPGIVGAAAISLDRTAASVEYVLNGDGMDGWFRKMEGPAKGYGIAVRDIKLTSKKDKLDGTSSPYERYDVKVTYLPSSEDTDDSNKYESSLGWLWVHRDYSLEEVLEYIKKNMKNWTP
jgi:hypothetical protein